LLGSTDTIGNSGWLPG